MLNRHRTPPVPASVRNWVREQMVLSGMPADTWRGIGSHKLRGQMVAALLVAASVEPRFTQRERDIALAASTRKPLSLSETFDPAAASIPYSYKGITHDRNVEPHIAALVVNDTGRVLTYQVRLDFGSRRDRVSYSRRLRTLELAQRQLAACQEALAALPENATAEQKYLACEAVPLVRLL